MFKKLASLPLVLAFSILIMTGIFILRIPLLPPQIPLFYSRLEGDAQITDVLMIFLLPALSSTIVAVNHFVTRKYFKENHFVQMVTYYVNISVIIIITFIFIRIIFLVT